MMYCRLLVPVYTNGFQFEPGIYYGITLLKAMTAKAETIWVEQEDGRQWFLVPLKDDPKSHKPDYTQPFDSKEFFWVKLTAVRWSEISGISEVDIFES